MSFLVPPDQSVRRSLGEIEGVEHMAVVELLSEAPDREPPVLVVTVIDGMVQHPESTDDLPLSQGYIDPREMADLLIEHGYAARIGEGR